jgi:hypothetical protein
MLLRERGANFNAPSHNALAASPLCAAAESEHIKFLNWLLAQGADPNIVALGQLPRTEAATLDRVDSLRVLLETGTDPNVNHCVMGDCPSFNALTGFCRDYERKALLQVIQILVEHGADPQRKVWKEKLVP